MNFFKLAQMRYSVRKFDPRPVEEKKVCAILAAAQVAPSARNRQSWRVLVIQDKVALEHLKACTPCHYHAPLAFLVCCDTADCYIRENDGKPSGEIDASIAATHMMLQACEMGVGSTWVMNFDENALRAAYGLPESIVPVALLVCGYPAGDVVINPRHKAVRPLNELCYLNDFTHPLPVQK